MSLQLAPDTTTIEKAKKLSTTKSWRLLAGTPSTIWGECKSNGLTYYKVAYDLKSKAFKCNCASQKIPCKHAVALSNIFTEQPDAFLVAEDLPIWVNEWILQGNPVVKKDTPEAEKIRAENRQKNFEKRLVQMLAGLDELENWLIDTLRQGIASLEAQPSSYWQEIAARLYDTKLSAIGKRVRNMPTLIRQSENWPELLLSELTSYYLVIRGLRKMEELPLNLQQDLLTFAGVTTRKEDLFQYGQTVKDTWMILGKLEGVEENLNYRRTWLLGYESKRYGLVLDYAFGKNPYPTNYTAGDVFVGQGVFYPSNAPLRLAIKDKSLLDRSVKRIIGFDAFSDYLAYYAKNLAANPLQQSFPCSLENVLPVFENKILILMDKHQTIIPLHASEDQIWKILAVSGGNSINIFGEWTGLHLIPLSLSIDNQFEAL